MPLLHTELFGDKTFTVAESLPSLSHFADDGPLQSGIAVCARSDVFLFFKLNTFAKARTCPARAFSSNLRTGSPAIA